MTRDSYKDFSKLEIIKSLILFSLFLYFSFFLSKEFSDCILHGFSFGVSVILPTVFPFMVISDFAISEFEFQKSAFLRKAFERWFKINGIGICAFVSGIIGGFPIGAKNAIDLFENGKISKCECERLMCFANLPGPAYVISAIGISILSSFKEGLVIYFSVLASAVICGKIIGIKKSYSINTSENIKQKFVFTSSVKRAALSSINVVFFISFFSGVCGFIEKLSIFFPLKCALISVLEIGSACEFIADSYIFSEALRLGIIAFSLSFSGLSVIMQSLALSEKIKFSLTKCILYKLLQGAVSFIIVILISL